METSTKLTATAMRQPVTALGKVIIGIQIFLALGALAGTIAIGLPGGISLGSIFLLNVALTIIIALGFRWAPIIGAVSSGASLIYIFFVNSYPKYHLTHTQDPLFVPLVIVVTLSALIFVAMLAAVAQNYWVPDRKLPRWFGYVTTGLVGVALGAVLLGLNVQPPTTSAPTTASDGSPIVHLELSTISPAAVTVPQGMKLDIMDDSAITHVLTYGTWTNGKLTLATPPNAPALGTHQISSGSFEIGPFTTAGTYEIICTVHPGMSLTVIVP